MLESFKTLDKKAEYEIVEKKSRFIANASPVETENEANEFITEIKKKYRDARHNVFAYQIGQNNEIIKQSDDGEPSGTAGLPVLDVLRGANIKNAVIVVTRYFGGILLGTGGLVRAYGKSAAGAVENAVIVEKTLLREIEIKADYSLLGKIQYETQRMGHIIKNIDYTDTILISVLTKEKNAEKFIEFITDITGGQAKTKKRGQSYYKLNKLTNTFGQNKI